MTKPRDWPNDAMEARNRSAEEAMRGIRALRPLISGEQFDRGEMLRRIAVALSALQTIAAFMISVGAPVRPE